MKKGTGWASPWIICLFLFFSSAACNAAPLSINPTVADRTSAIPLPAALPSPSRAPVTPSSTPLKREPEYHALLSWRTTRIMGLAWSPDSQRLATVAGDTLDDTHIHLIDLVSLHGSRFSEPAYDAASTFSPDGQELVVGSLGVLEVWKLSDQALLGRAPGNHAFFVTYFPGRSDSFMVATASLDNSPVETLSLQSVDSTWDFQPFLEVKGYLRNISLNANGSLLATAIKYFDNAADNGEHVLVWDLASKKQICRFGGMNVAFGAADTLGTAASDGISLWDARTCVLVKHFSAGPGYPYTITFSPDGKLLAFASGKNGIVILDASSGEVLQNLDGLLDYAEYIRFSPDGRFLATVSRTLDQTPNEAVLIVWKTSDDPLPPIELSTAFFETAK